MQRILRWLVRLLTGVDSVMADIAVKEAVRQSQRLGHEGCYKWEG